MQLFFSPAKEDNVVKSQARIIDTKTDKVNNTYFHLILSEDWVKLVN